MRENEADGIEDVVQGQVRLAATVTAQALAAAAGVVAEKRRREREAEALLAARLHAREEAEHLMALARLQMINDPRRGENTQAETERREQADADVLLGLARAEAREVPRSAPAGSTAGDRLPAGSKAASGREERSAPPPTRTPALPAPDGQVRAGEEAVAAARQGQVAPVGTRAERAQAGTAPPEGLPEQVLRQAREAARHRGGRGPGVER